MSTFTAQVAVVTGAASGIGRALTLQLASQGATLAISDVDESGLAETAGEARTRGARVRVDRLDVTDRAAFLAYAADVAQDLGGVHLVINNAGIAHSGDVEVMSLSEMQRVMDVDFWGVVNGTQAFLPHLIASGDGHLVNISSLFGLVSMPSQSAYNAAKYAVRGFTEALRMELLIAKHPVQVTCVHPGGIRTAIARTATASQGLDPSSLAELFDTKLARMSPEKAARIILRGTARGRARVLVGADAHAAHWLAKLLGSRYQVLLARAAARILPGTGAPGTATDSDRPALSRDRAAPPPAG